MTPVGGIRRAVRWAVAGVGLAVAGYATYVGVAWLRYGHTTPASRDDADELLNRFIPEYDVAERHHVRVAAPADVTLAAAAETDIRRSAIVSAIFRAREVVLGAEPDAAARPRSLLAEMKSLGWGVLAEVPGREIVVGAVTQPWKANVVFRALSPETFAAFHEPDYVKIVWTLRADPIGPADSIFRTETRVATTDAQARRKFRWYWARFSAGIIVIRRLTLGPVKTEAERRARERQTTAPNSRPTVAVTSMANTPQTATRAAPTSAGAPPARAAIAPSDRRQSSETAETAGNSAVAGATMVVSTGTPAPTANVAAEASAACSGRAASPSVKPSSSRA